MAKSGAITSTPIHSMSHSNPLPLSTMFTFFMLSVLVVIHIINISHTAPTTMSLAAITAYILTSTPSSVYELPCLGNIRPPTIPNKAVSHIGCTFVSRI